MLFTLINKYCNNEVLSKDELQKLHGILSICNTKHEFIYEKQPDNSNHENNHIVKEKGNIIKK